MHEREQQRNRVRSHYRLRNGGLIDFRDYHEEPEKLRSKGGNVEEVGYLREVVDSGLGVGREVDKEGCRLR